MTTLNHAPFQVSDTTEALGILDSKFSSQNNELGTHFASIRNGIEGAAQGQALKKELGETRLQYQVSSSTFLGPLSPAVPGKP